MVAGGLWVPRRLRAPKIQQPRSRRACLGELVQIDGCDHRWFEDRAPACTALVYVDDATSRLMVVLFVGVESTFAYFEATHEYLKHYGKPLAFYTATKRVCSGSISTPQLPAKAIRSSDAHSMTSISMECAPTPPRRAGSSALTRLFRIDWSRSWDYSGSRQSTSVANWCARTVRSHIST